MQGRAPTRRFHVPSAVRGSAARIDAARAASSSRNGALLVDVRRNDDPAVTLEGARRIPPDEIPLRLNDFRMTRRSCSRAPDCVRRRASVWRTG
jgi:NADPH-dependent 2,4-dienoyl-CoA reductase/sulfur reductase-like enzyme